MKTANLGAVRRLLLVSAVLTLSASTASAQVVERGRTWADLVASHPCDTGLIGRIARVTDCDAADDVGDGEGAFNCWVSCDGSAPWVTQAIGAGGGGAGVSGLTTADGGAAIADNTIIRGDGTEGIQGSAVTIADTTGNLQWEGTTADAFEGNFTFADPTADWTWAWGADGQVVAPVGSASAPTLSFAGNTGTGIYLKTTDQVGISAAGGEVAAFSSQGLALAGKISSTVAGTINGFLRLKVASTAGSGAPFGVDFVYSQAVFTNEGSSAENYYTLPGAIAGEEFTFVVQDADGIRITAAAGDTIRPIAGTAASATGGFIRCATQGAFITLVAINATEWVAIGSAGVWTIDI